MASILTDALTTYNFFVDVQGKPFAQFKECSGLGINVSVIEHRVNVAGGLPVTQKLPGAVHFEDIHLTRGRIIDDKEFWNWIKDVQNGKISDARKDGSVTLYDLPHLAMTTINFYGAWPYKVELGKLTAGADSVLIESLSLAVERIEHA